eukprot:TRINITY_DN104294_c0_g1_i1.p1 TRINITY_DN104294_c0_g1~~TRINITY_DN104294_c0_g1_i1.p1  ORF type:complete len:303 (-),score=37.34 TRINITY_DN104294_c0_g1_i1:42-929(-)
MTNATDDRFRLGFTMKKVEPLNYLEQGATTIMLRNLPRGWTVETILKKIHAAVPGEYDLINMPWDDTRDTNIALCFVNLVSHEAAKKAFDHFLDLSQSNPWTPRTSSCVSQSAIQGFESNLAYYVASTNRSPSDDPHAPLVIKDGIRLDVSEAIKKYVTTEHIQVALECAVQLKSVNKTMPKHSARKKRGRRKGGGSAAPASRLSFGIEAANTPTQWNASSSSEPPFPFEHSTLEGVGAMYSGHGQASSVQALRAEHVENTKQQPVASHTVMPSELAQVSQREDIRLASAVVYQF